MNRNVHKKRKTIYSPTLTAIIAAVIIIVVALIVIISDGIGDRDDGGNRGNKNEKIERYDNDGEKITLPEWITSDPIPKNEYSRPGDKTDDIVGIVVHYVGNPGTSAAANRSYFAKLAVTGETYASSNFVIGLDGEIIECVPLGEVAYCSNSRNRDTISIECCHPDADGKFTDATYGSLVKLCRWLAEIYDIKAENIIRHYDVTGKLCPLYFVEHEDEWENFKFEVFASAID